MDVYLPVEGEYAGGGVSESCFLEKWSITVRRRGWRGAHIFLLRAVASLDALTILSLRS